MFKQGKEKKRSDLSYWKNSESILRVKSSIGREQKQKLTGLEHAREEKRPIKEVLRLENSYGTIAFGGDKRQGLTLLVSEKRRHNEPAITADEKKLHGSRQTERFWGQGKAIANAGGWQEGAFAFSHQPQVSRPEMMDSMRQYLKKNEQETARRMMLFMMKDPCSLGEIGCAGARAAEKAEVAKKATRAAEKADVAKKATRAAEKAEVTKKAAGAKKAAMMERAAEKTGVLGQMENSFSQKLSQAIKEIKKESGEGKKTGSSRERPALWLYLPIQQPDEAVEEEPANAADSKIGSPACPKLGDGFPSVKIAQDTSFF